MNASFLRIAMAALALLLAGCSGQDDATARAAAAAGPDTSDTGSRTVANDASKQSSGGDPGVLTGRVFFDGDVPPPRRITVTKDQDACQHGAGEVQDVVVAADGALAGVVLEIQGLDRPPAHQPAEGTYAVRQTNCRFDPELLVVPDGASLTIYNDDSVLHNINTGQWNLAQPAGFRPLTKTIRFMRRPFVRIHCNIHEWMEAWIYVARSPFYAVTGSDGRFRIDGIPPGSYTVTASHARIPVKQFDITVGSGDTVERDLHLSRDSEER